MFIPYYYSELLFLAVWILVDGEDGCTSTVLLLDAFLLTLRCILFMDNIFESASYYFTPIPLRLKVAIERLRLGPLHLRGSAFLLYVRYSL